MFQRFSEAGSCSGSPASRFTLSAQTAFQSTRLRLGVAFLVAFSLLVFGVSGASAETDVADIDEDVQMAESVETSSAEDAADESDESDEVVETVIDEDEVVEVVEEDEVSEVAETASDTEDEIASEDLDSEPGEQKTKGIEVIIVEAQRRSEDRQKIPESISSFSGLDLAEQGLENFDDLQYSVPNLFSGGGLTQITLRGVGSEIVGPGIDPGFAVHVNNVFSARESTGLLDFYDIERIDVSRGPQGTLWGRNSTGGSVNVITRRPTHEFDVSTDVQYGSFAGGNNVHDTRWRGVVNMPLVEDVLAMRVAFLAYYNKGITLNETDSNKQNVNNADTVTLRTSLRWEPFDDVKIDFIGSYFRSTNAGALPKFEGDFSSPNGITRAGAGPGANYTIVSPPFLDVAALPNPKDPFKSAVNERGHSDATLYSATLLADWDISDFKIQSITGFQLTNFELHRDQDGSSLDISTLDLIDKSRQVSQEFLISTHWDRPYNFIFGANYQYDWTPNTEVFVPNAANTAGSVFFNIQPHIIGITLVDDCDPAVPATCPAIKPAGTRQEDFVNAKTSVKNHVVGVYSNVAWEIIDDLTITLGGRYSYTYRQWDDTSVAQTYVTFLNPLFPFLACDETLDPAAICALQVYQRGLKQDNSWEAGTWRLALDYQATSDLLVWGSVSTGQRAGGFNFIDEQPFRNEKIFAIQSGIKSLWFDNRLMFNVTGFWYDWDYPQIRAIQDSIPTTVNAPSAESYGIEFDWRALPIDNLALNGSFGWLEANYDKQFVTADGTVQDLDPTTLPTNRTTPIDLNGNRLPRSARFTASVGAQYTWYMGDYGVLSPRVDFYYRDDVSFRQYNNPKDVQKAYTRTDARISWRSGSEQYSAELYVRNLENKAVKTNQETLFSIYRQHYFDSPRTIGFRLGYNY